MFRYACMTLFLVLGSEIQLSYCTEVFVYDAAQKLCLYANLNVNFTVTYEAIGKVNRTVKFPLPETVNATGSTCVTNTSTLNIRFGKGHSWNISFTKKNETYNGHKNVFTYNLTDDSIFKNASSNETKSVTFNPSISNVVMDTYYSCKSEDTMTKDLVIQTLWNVTLQAFIINGSKSDKDTVCAKDRITTPAPATNATTATIPTTLSPTPLPLPTTGNYNVTNGSSLCLLADMGLQISFKEGVDFQKMNIEPFKIVTGTCGTNKSNLVLQSDQVNLTFAFLKNGDKFLLRTVNVTIKGTNGTTFNAANSNLSLWQAAVESSYMCNKEQSYNITDTFSLKTFNLRVQPFGVKENKFGTAYECALDDTSMLIPIVVGAALAGLIVIVLIVYAIGRRKTYVGYQTL
ncbi:hypothetical protein SKAU_G00226860 [Synaphobranchus kaupii]|uniref:Lysosome-associated membrane glycoprotein 2 n=1 Tax=Synaphobranchus kaupii TaxID=118154 RepID=A0A9Q1F529_SYNKA|nr:hypothetical protein SKAU_G00226860 [Synaphobranchus kaupii]